MVQAVADVFKAALPKASKIALPRSTSREEIKQALATHPRTLELLTTEVETMGEDWLVALQDELTKPYFLSVSEQADLWSGLALDLSPPLAAAGSSLCHLVLLAHGTAQRIRHCPTSKQKSIPAQPGYILVVPPLPSQGCARGHYR